MGPPKTSLRRPPWSKGYTKKTHPSLARMADKMRTLDNLKAWRNKQQTYWRSLHQPLAKDDDLAELIGVVLGDGNISAFPRSERLVIACNTQKPKFSERYATMVEKLFKKKPKVLVSPTSNSTRISIYQKFISKRLDVPAGNRGKISFSIPSWIWNNSDFLIRYLRGLYEAEGSFCVHKPTSTYKMLFSNRNPSLLENVFRGVQKLGFHPHRSGYQIQLSRKEEVYRFKELIQFRVY